MLASLACDVDAARSGACLTPAPSPPKGTALRRSHVTRYLRALFAACVFVCALLGGAQTASASQAASFSKTTFDFGDVAIQSAKYEAITVTSTGTEPLQLLGVTPGPNGYETLFFTKDWAPLAPGASRTYYVAADPWTVGAVDTTLSVEYGDENGVQGAVTLGVKYNAVPQPVLPYAHFDLRLNDVGWNLFLFNDIALQPVGGATGSAPGKFIFRISSGTVSQANMGVLISSGGIELRKGGKTATLKKIGVDLTRGRLTTVVSGNRRIDIADLEGISDSWDLEGRPITSAVVVLNAAGAAQLNAAGVQPSVAAGEFIGSIEILKG